MKRFFAVLIAAVLLLTAFAGCSGAEKESPVAYKVGNLEFTVEDMNYMYVTNFNDMYNNLYYTYGEYLSSVIDITKPLEEQMFSETMSWHDYIMDYTVNTVKSFAGIYEKAIENGFVLPEVYQNDLDTIEEQIDSVAEEAGMTRDEYIHFMYADAVSLETIKKMSEFRYIALVYAQEYEANISVSEEDIEAYYEANKRDLDTVDFRYYTSYYEETAEEETSEEASEETPEESAEETTEETAEEEEKTLTQEEAKAQAEALAEVHTGEEFNALAFEYTTKESQKKLFDYGDATIFAGSAYASTGIEEVSEWLFDEARQYGDTMIHHDEEYNSYLTIMFEERVDPDYSSIDVRHILVKAETDEEENISDEEWERVKAKAQEILDTYLAGEQTEEAFSELAKEHSDDGNASTGGIYENVTKGQMVSNFNDWCFDAMRKPGDTGLVITPFGMHVMYFVGEGDNCLETKVRPILAQEKLNTWVADCSVNLTEEKTEDFEKVGGIIDEIVAVASESANSEKETSDPGTAIIVAVLVAIIIVCIIIIVKKKTTKNDAAEEENVSEEADSEETELPEATDEDLTEEELLAEEAFEENASDEVTEESSEEVSEEEKAEE